MNPKEKRIAAGLGLRARNGADRSLGRWRRRLTASGSALVAGLLGLGLLLSGCSGGSGNAASGEIAAQQGGGAIAPGAGGGTTTAASNCTGSCADTPTRLTAGDVQQVMAQAVAEAQARGVVATIAVVDRVGNVLGVFKMSSTDVADSFVTVTSTADGSPPVVGGLESVNIVPAEAAAIAKAVTGAYLSSEGNAFTTRTASQIVQEHFNPGERDTPSGPLFGVQFSQLPCSDFTTRFEVDAGTGLGGAPGPGPHRSPLGLSADPGGLPLYKGGTPVGGIGVMTDGIYGLDKSLAGFDNDVDEFVATAGTVGFAAPINRRGDVITLIGKTARFSDVFVDDLQSDPAAAASFAAINGVAGSLVAVRGYYDGGIADPTAAGDAARTVLAGTAFGLPESGIIAAPAGEFSVGGVDQDAFIFVDAAGNNRFPPRAGLDTPGGSAQLALTADEVRALLSHALSVANRGRAQIRQPDGTPIRVSASIVDSSGNILGIARTRDAPSFGADVSLQKARTAAFYSGTGRVGGQSPADALRGVADPLYLGVAPLPPDPATLVVLDTPAPRIADYVTATQDFIGIPAALEASGPAAAFSDRAGGNLSRPTFPDGPDNSPHGPFSKAPGEWSIFSVGLQLDLVYNDIIQHVAFLLGVVPDVPIGCTGNSGLDFTNLFVKQNVITGIGNGIQIFPGSVPIYRGDLLVGGIGISGDGVDQDDMISFLGLHNAGLEVGGINNAPSAIRADTIDIPGFNERLRYVNCPQAPFNDSDEDDVCDGK